MINIKKLLTAILNMITITVEYVETSQITLNANTNENAHQFSVAKSGYTPIGIVGSMVVWVSGETAAVNVYQTRIVGTAATVSARNMGTAQVKFKIGLYVLYRKNWGVLRNLNILTCRKAVGVC